MDLPWILIPIAEEIIFKCSHGQSTWREQRTQYLHLPIKSIFVSRVNNLCYSPSWKTRQCRYLSNCRACIGKQHQQKETLYIKLQIISISRQAGGKKRVKKTPECLVFPSKFLLFISRRSFQLENSTYIKCSDSQCLSALQV